MIGKKSNIPKKLKTISSVFDIQKILTAKINQDSITSYYKINKLAYSLFHSRENLIHVGISKNNIFNKEDLKELPRFVNKYIHNKRGFKVLELATGRGANANLILSAKTDIEYTGIDISDAQLSFANKIIKKFQNYKLLKQDFHDLSIFSDKSFELVFVIESLCYSNNKEQVLNEVYRILKPGGRFIVIDGYLQDDLDSYSIEQRIAFKLVEVGMAIKNSDTYNNFLHKPLENKFQIEYEENVSNYVIPSMERLERFARAFFKFRFLSIFLKNCLPKEFVYNAITAYLWSDLVKEKVACYYITVLKK